MRMLLLQEVVLEREYLDSFILKYMKVKDTLKKNVVILECLFNMTLILIFSKQIITIMLFKKEEELSEFFSDDKVKARHNRCTKSASTYFSITYLRLLRNLVPQNREQRLSLPILRKQQMISLSIMKNRDNLFHLKFCLSKVKLTNLFLEREEEEIKKKI